MKKLITISFLCFCITTLFSQTKPVTIIVNGEKIIAYSESHALVIGISNYTYLKKLPGVKKDIAAISKTLRENGFKVITKTDLNKSQIDRAFTDFITRYGQKPDNRLLVYFAGHGYTMTAAYGGDKGYFVPYDAPKPSVDAAGFRAKSIDMSRIEHYATEIQSKHALFVFDACFAGTIFYKGKRGGEEIINYNTKMPVRQFITSGSADEEVPDKSIFREQFVTALTSEYADRNNDGYLTCTELGEFLKEKVIAYGKGIQHPQYGKIRDKYLDKGDFVFVLPKKPQKKYGTIHLKTEISGKLYFDNSFYADIISNSEIIIPRQITGRHTLKIRGSENWTASVTVYKKQTTRIIAKSNSRNKTAGSTFLHNKTGLTMVWTGGGTFQMGSNSSDAYDNEKPVHTVSVGNFSLSQTEITNSQYCKFLNERGNQSEGGATWLDIKSSYCQIEKRGGAYYPKSGKENHPVIKVTWYGAKAYCKWAGGRLPTEAEWQFAAKANSNYKYAGSNNIDEVAWYSGNSGSKSHKVAQKKANAFGLYDMSGNVWEWTEDKWHSNYTGAPTDGSAWTSGSSSYRVHCGGSWRFNARFSRSSVRYDGSPDGSGGRIGFRLCH